jgi:hypothetical protein
MKKLSNRERKQKEIENFERQRRIYQFKKVITDFRRMGFEVKEVAPFQFQINECLEILPITREFNDLKKKVKGTIKGVSFDSFVREYFGLSVQ